MGAAIAVSNQDWLREIRNSLIRIASWDLPLLPVIARPLCKQEKTAAHQAVTIPAVGAPSCPAVGQGALAIETRSGENTCQLLDHAETRAAVTAERALLAALGGGCSTPVGAHARVEGIQLKLMAVVLSPDGSRSVGDSAVGSAAEPELIGRELGEKLLAQGAAQLLGL